MVPLALGQNLGVLRPLQPPFLGPASASTATTAAASQLLPDDIGLQSAFQPRVCKPKSLTSPSATSPREAGSCLRPGAIQAPLELPHLPQGPAALPQVSQGEEVPLLIVIAPCLVLLTSNLREAEGHRTASILGEKVTLRLASELQVAS